MTDILKPSPINGAEPKSIKHGMSTTKKCFELRPHVKKNCY